MRKKVEEEVSEIIKEQELELGEIEKKLLAEKLANDLSEIICCNIPMSVDEFSGIIKRGVETKLAGCKNGRVNKRRK